MTGSNLRVGTRSRWEDAEEAFSGRSPPAAAKPEPKVAAGGGARGREVARLVRAIESEVVPRLLLAHRAAPDCRSEHPSAGPGPGIEDVAKLAALVLGRDEAAAAAFVDALRGTGIPVEVLYLDLLAPVARRLGDLWVADLCDFTDVTVGLCRLQQVLRGLSQAFQDEGERPLGHVQRALLVPAPGEQHTFGLLMVAEFFRRAGWEVSGEAGGEPAALVRGRWFAVVGLSASSDVKLDVLASCIRAVRRASRNKGVGILVGGPLFTGNPELAARVGADATATDGRQAVLQAQNLLALLPADR